ncbi:MAG: hypothetical protein HKN26_13650 [Acidimicrobiales bacterium]|nr:hypothetical protein [Acidimicrobiales bacterium]
MARSSRIAAAVVLVAAVVVSLAQVQVEHDETDASRACGSALDTMVDRSGWELWWSQDLAEPSPSVRAALVRTHLCPDAVNRMIGIAAGLTVAAAALALMGRASRRPDRVAEGTVDTLQSRLTRLGRTSASAALALLLAGVIAVIVLVADADSTLFLYTDRLVVAVIGLLILVPILALWLIARFVIILGESLGSLESAGTNDQAEQ